MADKKYVLTMQRMWNYLLTVFFRKKPARVSLEIVRRETTGLRLQEWRSQPELINLAAAIWKDENFRLMMQVAANESPANFAILSGDTETRAFHQVRNEGYNLALANLKAMCVPIDKLEPLETTYEPEEQTI